MEYSDEYYINKDKIMSAEVTLPLTKLRMELASFKHDLIKAREANERGLFKSEEFNSIESKLNNKISQYEKAVKTLEEEDEN